MALKRIFGRSSRDLMLGAKQPSVFRTCEWVYNLGTSLCFVYVGEGTKVSPYTYPTRPRGYFMVLRRVLGRSSRDLMFGAKRPFVFFILKGFWGPIGWPNGPAGA